jgi:hypothetical protein
MKEANLATTVDFDLYGLVGIRLLETTPKDTAVVTRQLGLDQSELHREPDLYIRFVDRLPITSPVHYIGVDEAGFTKDAFLVMRSVHKIPARVQIPFEQVGKPCEIVCERGLPAVPLLISILNLTILNNGTLPLHSSAFRYQDCGILVTGWSKGGKTETLLAFMSNGAEYIGDEWIYLHNDQSRMVGIPEPIRLWQWHLSDMPQYQVKAGNRDRAKLRMLRILIHALDWSVNGAGKKSSAGMLAGRLTSILKRQQYVQISPEDLFGKDACSLQGTLDKVFFVISSDQPGVIVEPVRPQEVAQRIIHSLQAEYSDFLSYYSKFKFAFPSKRNELIEQMQDRQLAALQKVLANKEAYAVYHPYPVHIPALYEAIKPYCSKGA